MRILNIVHQYLPERVGGTELYTQAVAGALAARGHEVGVFHRSDDPTAGLKRRRDEANVAVWAASAGRMSAGRRFLASYRNPTLQAAFQAVLAEFQPNLVHIQHLMGLPTALGHTLRRARVPYVITLWDFWWRCANAQLLTNYSGEICPGPSATFFNCAHCAIARAGRPNWSPLIPFVAPLMARRNAALQPIIDAAARLIAPTDFVRRWYMAHGFPAERVVELAPALDYRGAEQRRPVGASLPPVELARLRVAYIGGLSSQKGVHVLIEAFAGLRGAAELWVAGDLSADPAYGQRLRDMAGGNVRLLGRLDRQQVWQTLAEVDVVAVPTLWYETYSFIISEAFAAGRPVLASRLGPIADRVRHDADGLLLSPGDVGAWRAALQGLIDSPERLARLTEGVRSPQSLTQHADALEMLYGKVLRAS